MTDEQKPSGTEEMLTNVATTIGSALGTVAAKMNELSKAASGPAKRRSRPKAGKKSRPASRKKRPGKAKRSTKAAGRKSKARKKSKR